MVLQIDCSGSPYEIGRCHGLKASGLITSSIAFYTDLFQQTSQMDWELAKKTALGFAHHIKTTWPHLFEEMQGIADASDLDLADILALNLRTEITFGMFTEGCTSLSWKTTGNTFISQNWDWMEEQKPNIVLLCIEQEGRPSIKMLAEAGLVGKIGLNSAGVGVCCNAIRAKGMDSTRLPMHLALRTILNSSSMDDAVKTLERYGVATACHFLVGDITGTVGMEWSHLGCTKLLPVNGRIYHSNHLLVDQVGIQDTRWLPDSFHRVRKIQELTDTLSNPTVESIQMIFKDETNYPNSICRSQIGDSKFATLFNIVMRLEAKEAHVTVGNPARPDELMRLSF